MNKRYPVKSICCIGAGYVGGPTMAVIADRCPDIQVKVVDLNEDRIRAWNEKDLRKLPVFEPGLDKVVDRARGRNLHFSISVSEAISSADLVFISVNTPTKKRGLGAGQASDLRWVEACARQVAENATGHTVVVEKSTLPVRTAAAIQSILQAAQKNSKKGTPSPTFSVLSNPEFLSEGTAIDDLENPDRVLIGGNDPDAIEALASIYTQWVSSSRIIRTNLWSSELAKLLSNAFLAQRISSINSAAAICEATGADVSEVSKAIGTDTRIGNKFLNAGPGFGGSCFQKDILNLVYLCRYFGLEEVSAYWEKVVEINIWQQHRISRLVVQKLFGTITSKRIAILGFAFKANTNDTRESPAIRICKDFLEEGAELTIHDPKVSIDQIERDLKVSPINDSSNYRNSGEGTWIFSKSVLEAVDGADAVVILTEWSEYQNLNWCELAKQMRAPSWIFDTRSVVNSLKVKQAGLTLWRIGEGQG
tara:strand:- start:2320 stop:3753 length:1434 start_codon:yes stop_codon:yes gene_type:complete